MFPGFHQMSSMLGPMLEAGFRGGTVLAGGLVVRSAGKEMLASRWLDERGRAPRTASGLAR
jgi:hypothetical protein